MGKKDNAYHHGDLRKSLISQALAIVREEGVAKLTLRKVARLAGVSHAAPAHHFKDMNGLLAAIAEEGFVKMVQHMKKAAGKYPSENSLERFKAIGVSYVEFATQNPSFIKIMNHPSLAEKSLYPGLKRASNETFNLLTNAVQECQSKKLVREGDVLELSLFAWSTVHGLAVLAVDGQLNGVGLRQDLQVYTDKVTDLLYSGLM
ncbi:MAG TPA: TetR family transcriptional regulator [Desulfobacteraceae bacterium]|nr:TetR family transcriptional regulator [Desulfobacteraceae bacterium]|tara:strand:+ start:991 stop:1602 length:612 start_codon:yes stop_codon:yes gene_type:complete